MVANLQGELQQTADALAHREPGQPEGGDLPAGVGCFQRLQHRASAGKRITPVQGAGVQQSAGTGCRGGVPAGAGHGLHLRVAAAYQAN